MAKTREEIEATVSVDVTIPRGGRLLVAEPGDGTRITLLLLDMDYIPSGTAREVGILPNSFLIVWGNPTRNPGRRAITFISKSQTQVRVRSVRQELGCSVDDAKPIAELIGYALTLPVQGL